LIDDVVGEKEKENKDLFSFFFLLSVSCLKNSVARLLDLLKFADCSNTLEKMGGKAKRQRKPSPEEKGEEEEEEEKEEELVEVEETETTEKQKKQKTKTNKKTKKMTKRELMEKLKASLMESAAKLMEEEKTESSKKIEEEEEEEEEVEVDEEDDDEETGDEQSQNGSDDEEDAEGEIEFMTLQNRKGDERKKIAKKSKKVVQNGVVYIGHLPHGFYEVQLVEFFSQFGKVRRARVSRTKKGHSRHFGYLQFEDPDVAPIAVGAMNGYLMFNHVLRCVCIPPEDIHPEIFKGAFVAGSKKAPFRGVKNTQKIIKQRNAPRDEEKRSTWESRRLKRAREAASKLQRLGFDIEHPLVEEMEKRKKRKKVSDEEMEVVLEEREEEEEAAEEREDEQEEEKEDEVLVEKKSTPKQRYGLRRNRKPAKMFTPEKKGTEEVANKEKAKKKKGTPAPKKTPRHRKK
jgi:nucleolar protein 15